VVHTLVEVETDKPDLLCLIFVIFGYTLRKVLSARD